MNYINVDLNSNTPPKCQCGTYLAYDEDTNRLSCPNSNCIKKRLVSVLETLTALDKLTRAKGENYELVTLAKKNYDLLEQFISTCDIHYGIELITKGLDLTILGELGVRLSTIIDSFGFKLNELSSLCGSKLLTQLNIDFSRLAVGNKRLAIAQINEQLGIDGSILLATLIYENFEHYINLVLTLTDYVTLYRPSTRKRSSIPVTLAVPDDYSYDAEFNSTDRFASSIISSTSTITLDSTQITETSSNENISESALEELLEW